jgi:hypothetical protein
MWLSLTGLRQLLSQLRWSDARAFQTAQKAISFDPIVQKI